MLLLFYSKEVLSSLQIFKATILSVLKMFLKLTLVSVLLLFFFKVVFSSGSLTKVKRYSEDQCGKPLIVDGLIYNGVISEKDKWPFLAAFFDNVRRKFFCGGSLISRRHILSAAHCLQPKKQTAIKKPSDVIAYLGKYNLNDAHERGAVPAYPIEFFIHPGWKSLEPVNYDADIAIIKLEEEVPLRKKYLSGLLMEIGLTATT